MLPDIGLPELVLIFAVVLIVFGPGKIPELARGMGRVVREVRSAAREFTRDFTAEMEQEANRPRNQVVCPSCANLNPVGNQYCGSCGRALAKS